MQLSLRWWLLLWVFFLHYSSIKALKKTICPNLLCPLGCGCIHPLIWIFGFPQLLTIIRSLFSYLVYSCNLPLNELLLPPVTSKLQKYVEKRNRSEINAVNDLRTRYFLNRVWKYLGVDKDYKSNTVLQSLNYKLV